MTTRPFVRPRHLMRALCLVLLAKACVPAGFMLSYAPGKGVRPEICFGRTHHGAGTTHRPHDADAVHARATEATSGHEGNHAGHAADLSDAADAVCPFAAAGAMQASFGSPPRFTAPPPSARLFLPASQAPSNASTSRPPPATGPPSA